MTIAGALALPVVLRQGSFDEVLSGSDVARGIGGPDVEGIGAIRLEVRVEVTKGATELLRVHTARLGEHLELIVGVGEGRLPAEEDVEGRQCGDSLKRGRGKIAELPNEGLHILLCVVIEETRSRAERLSRTSHSSSLAHIAPCLRARQHDATVATRYSAPDDVRGRLDAAIVGRVGVRAVI
jgi:hypothetical protein